MFALWIMKTYLIEESLQILEFYVPRKVQS